MALRQRIFGQQRRSGATAKDLIGNGDHVPLMRASKVKGRFTLEWRHAAHIHRYFGEKRAILSYQNARETAISGARLYLEGLSADDISPAQSRTVAMLHDARFNRVQRQVAVRDHLRNQSALTLDFDDASKRGISFLGAGLHASRVEARSRTSEQHRGEGVSSDAGARGTVRRDLQPSLEAAGTPPGEWYTLGSRAEAPRAKNEREQPSGEGSDDFRFDFLYART